MAKFGGVIFPDHRQYAETPTEMGKRKASNDSVKSTAAAAEVKSGMTVSAGAV